MRNSNVHNNKTSYTSTEISTTLVGSKKSWNFTICSSYKYIIWKYGISGLIVKWYFEILYLIRVELFRQNHYFCGKGVKYLQSEIQIVYLVNLISWSYTWTRYFFELNSSCKNRVIPVSPLLARLVAQKPERSTFSRKPSGDDCEQSMILLIAMVLACKICIIRKMLEYNLVLTGLCAQLAEFIFHVLLLRKNFNIAHMSSSLQNHIITRIFQNLNFDLGL